MMMSERKANLLKLLALVLRPAIRFCLRHSLRLQDFLECAKTVFIEESAQALESQGQKRNISRISVMSGVHRRDVARIQEYGLQLFYEPDVVTKVLGMWQSSSQFSTGMNEAKPLSCDGEKSEFVALVRSVSKDINPATVLFELERVKAVEKREGKLHLRVESFVPKGNTLQGFNILAHDADDLTRTVEENVLSAPAVPQFHARTEYDNVRPDALPEIKRWFLREGHEFHARVRAFVSKFDQDIHPDPKFNGKGSKVVFSAFSNVSENGDS